jgi:hypothetical protein
MESKQRPIDLALLVTGVGVIVGSFSPWISVVIVNVAGTSGFRGYITLTGGLMISLFASTRLWPNLLSEKLVSKLNLFSKVSLGASLFVLVEVAVRIRQLAGQLTDVAYADSATDTSGATFGDTAEVFGEFADSLLDAFRPRLAIGWYVCLISVVLAAVVLTVSRKQTSLEN